MTLETNDILKFTRSKEYSFEKFMGQGGTGKTVLLKDDILNTFFVCKKYEPSAGNDKDDCFNRFINEIKILYKLSHINIVKIYNNFLYPQNKAGYILMEYIEGTDIEEFLLWEKPETFEKIFIQLIEGFNYLENHLILHRDIKPQNILITKDGVVKIIDFGFGKKMLADNDRDASILLNWPVSEFPEEIKGWKYDHKTEIYFLGKMFNRLLKDNNINNFKYQYIVNKMIVANSNNRISSFSLILSLIATDVLQQINFSDNEKNIYTVFATALSESLVKYRSGEPKFEYNPDVIVEKLEKTITENSLEKYIQNNNSLIECFLSGKYSYYSRRNIDVCFVIDFYKFFISKPDDVRRIILSNIISRLKTIPIEMEDELPF